MNNQSKEFDPYQAMDCLKEGIVCHEINGRISFCNKAAEKILGLTREEILQRSLTNPLWQSIYKDGTDFPGEFPPPIHTLKTGMPQNDIVMGIRKPAGELTWIRVNSYPVFSEDTQLKAVVTSFADITELKQASEKNINELQFNFDMVLENTDEAFVITDKNFQVIFYNKAAKKMARQINNSHLQTGVPLVDLVATEEARKQLEPILPEILAGKKREFVRHYDLADGSLRVLQVNYRPLYKEEDVTGIVINTRDITEKYFIEQELIKMNEQLKYRAAELTASNEELKQFAYVASHDLQEPLRTVTSFLKLLKRRCDSLDEKSKSYVEFAVIGAERMKKLILDLLDFSRVTTRHEEREPVDCNEVVKQSLADLVFLIKEKNAKVLSEDLPEVKAIRGRMQQVFQNLISNALKYNDKDRPEIQLGYTEKENHWEFYIKDNGIGIEPKDHERIFIIFQQLHERNKYQGTGIGLAIVKKIIERHGGRIWVQSVPGEGSTFYFSLPK